MMSFLSFVWFVAFRLPWIVVSWVFASIYHRLVRPIFRFLWRVFLYTLPLTFVSLSYGALCGFFIYFESTSRMQVALQDLVSNVQSAQQMDWFSVPGGPGIHDLGIAPYHIVQLRDPTNWWTKLGLVRFDTDMELYPPFGFESYFSLADPHQLYRPVAVDEQGRQHHPWHHWVYASQQYVAMDDLFFDEWDRDFNLLMQHHYAHPAAYNASFHYIKCPGDFLCGMWWIKGPALIHLTTESTTKDELRPVIPGFEPVRMRLFELPQPSPRSRLLPGTFPSAFSQMLSITGDPEAWEDGQPVESGYTTSRIAGLLAAWEAMHPNTLGVLASLYHLLIAKLGLDPPYTTTGNGTTDYAFSFGSAVAFTTADLLFPLVNALWNVFWSLVSPEVVDDDAENLFDMLEDNDEAPLQNNFMAQMLEDFLDTPAGESGKSVRDMFLSSNETEQILQKMRYIVQNGPPVDEELDANPT